MCSNILTLPVSFRRLCHNCSHLLNSEDWAYMGIISSLFVYYISTVWQSVSRANRYTFLFISILLLRHMYICIKKNHHSPVLRINVGIFTAKSLKIFKIGTFACQLTMKWLRQIFSTTMTFELQTHIGIIRVTRYWSTMTLTLRRSCIRQKLIAILTPDTMRYLSDHYELFIPIYCYFLSLTCK